LNKEIDNTGNVRIWPSEEFLAVWCLMQKEKWRGKSVCEFGAGKSGLAGLTLSTLECAESVLITDGNEICEESLRENISLNSSTCKSKVLKWGEESKD